ncbi:pilus assembly protein [Rhodoferax sp. AJA081-3]|uniref:pilus assembly PilX family protein n=1 Tax=Rhodoferax sp. AJA081-3 TaxID=2752316 RepID=UPI001AE0263C|nr:PilX N-terminal domain-containing pilus assembly protein [Rhodoferax sp. AJA081-3]QTN29283.1 pilus assembly protein [Rhodoferax sp. AJA081-3]
MKTLFLQRTKVAPAQKGVALIISLILLLVMSLLGVAAIRGIAMEERMAGQTYDRSLAFQATESALREAEALVEGKPADPVGSGCAVVSGLMLCSTPLASDTPRWMNSSFSDWKDATTVGSGTLAVTPQYFVEFLGTGFPCDPSDNINNLNCKRYRVTARSRDNTDGRASVMLQSIYAID